MVKYFELNAKIEENTAIMFYDNKCILVNTIGKVSTSK